jgi:hypothetical protein
LTGNVARSNGETGFRSDTGGGDVLVGNVATANGLDGFGISFASLADVFRGNLSEGNARDGFAIASGTGPHVIVGNSIIGNGGFGVVLAVGTTATINGLPIDASNNFWGAEGPGADPADNAGTLSCDGGAKVTVVRPAATKEFKVKPKIKL